MSIKEHKIRPYARLLTMLGEQLIRNEQIALAELIKNAYDADADWVKISFIDFDIKEGSDSISINSTEKSKIRIEDNGCGMTEDVIERSWMNPATPNKKTRNSDERSAKKRILQGEKGIGRFAILKLGRKIGITTRPLGTENHIEYFIDYDLSKYDDDFLTEDGKNKELFIDNISINVESREPSLINDRIISINGKPFVDNNHGTCIEISGLKGSWDYGKIKEVYEDTLKLKPIFSELIKKEEKFPFEIGFEINGRSSYLVDTESERLNNLLKENTVITIKDGKFNEKKREFTYKLNGTPQKLTLNDPRLAGLSVFKEYFLKDTLFDNKEVKATDCGNFNFNFYIFDFVADKETRYYLSKVEKDLIKKHRIYLYRDGIRVAPYGDPDNDWLETDKKRATGRTGDYLSNDQVVGFVDITKKGNPKLRDKTNREGLIEEGSSMRDFIMLLHSFLLFIRQHPYKQYQEQNRQKKEQETKKLQVVQSKFDELKNVISNNSAALALHSELVKSYQIEKDFYEKRLETTEELAGVGLSVETSSHDMMMMLLKSIDSLDSVIKEISYNSLFDTDIEKELHSIRGMLSFVTDQMKDIQLLFRSSKQRRREIRILDILQKVEKIYARSLKRNNITYKVHKIGSPIAVKCTDAVLLQVLINLFDNAIYWLSVIDSNDKRIEITLDGDNKQVIFSDSGPGIYEDDKPYIFEAFYSGKEEGRGLGLYIARQLLRRLGYDIYISEIQSENKLSGANFVINFIKAESNE